MRLKRMVRMEVVFRVLGVLLCLVVIRTFFYFISLQNRLVVNFRFSCLAGCSWKVPLVWRPALSE